MNIISKICGKNVFIKSYLVYQRKSYTFWFTTYGIVYRKKSHWTTTIISIYTIRGTEFNWNFGQIFTGAIKKVKIIINKNIKRNVIVWSRATSPRSYLQGYVHTRIIFSAKANVSLCNSSQNEFFSDISSKCTTRLARLRCGLTGVIVRCDVKR